MVDHTAFREQEMGLSSSHSCTVCCNPVSSFPSPVPAVSLYLGLQPSTSKSTNYSLIQYLFFGEFYLLPDDPALSLACLMVGMLSPSSLRLVLHLITFQELPSREWSGKTP